MGIVNFGVPEVEASYLKEELGLNTFVEGGTYKGDTALHMSEKFNKVITIENSSTMYDIAKKNIKEKSNITLLKGDTREHLNHILEHEDNILFWLDAHWSGGETYGEEDECPLIEELEIIFSYNKKHVILIDDARLFLAPPPLPHDYKNWPSLPEIIKTMPEGWTLLELDDVIYMYPENIKDAFNIFIQKTVTKKWESFGKGSIVEGIKILINGIINRRL